MSTTIEVTKAKVLVREIHPLFIAQLTNAFQECDETIQDVVMNMVELILDPETRPEERQRASMTAIEALFPGFAESLLATEKNYETSPSIARIKSRMEEEKTTFSARLTAELQKRDWSQEYLAKITGVGQPAISNMINRNCRPQRRTIIKIAKALNVQPEELWPGFHSQ